MNLKNRTRKALVKYLEGRGIQTYFHMSIEDLKDLKKRDQRGDRMRRKLKNPKRRLKARSRRNPQQLLTRAKIEKITFAYYKIQDDLKWLARELGRKQVWPRETLVQDIAAKLRMSIPAVRQVVESIR